MIHELPLHPPTTSVRVSPYVRVTLTVMIHKSILEPSEVKLMPKSPLMAKEEEYPRGG